MTRTLISLLTLFSFLVFLPAYAADSGAKKGAEAAQCCSTDCSQCAKECEKALAYSKKKGGEYAKAEHLNALKDCIALCKACSDLESRDSALSAKAHALCAEACRKCADSCKKLDDKKLAACVEQCNTCAKSCDAKSEAK